eukprot:4643516-Prorocentrum_lima.AAC.1
MASGSGKAQRLCKSEEEEEEAAEEAEEAEEAWDAVDITPEDWQFMSEGEQAEYLRKRGAPSQKVYRNLHMAMARDA